jgi:anti-anti-sigma regulatory factor
MSQNQIIDAPADGRLLADVHIIERTAVVRFPGTECLFDEATRRPVWNQLDSLIRDDGHSRLLVSLDGAQYLPGVLLGKLASIAKRIEPVRGRIQVCGLDPPLRDMLRIARLVPGVFDVFADEAEALGLSIPRAGT